MKTKKIRAWALFDGNKIQDDEYNSNCLAIYRTNKAAENAIWDGGERIVRVEIREIPIKKKGQL